MPAATTTGESATSGEGVRSEVQPKVRRRVPRRATTTGGAVRLALAAICLRCPRASGLLHTVIDSGSQ